MANDGDAHSVDLPAVSHGQIFSVKEIVARGASALNLSVRVTGRLCGVNRAECRASLADAQVGGESLLIDTSQVMEQHFRSGDLTQIIGELGSAITCNTSPLVLRARILRNVDGLDLELFNKTVQAKRDFERELGLLPGHFQ
eukprot:scaffold137660_cov22-Tisochrysis_lutea.AAC.1